MKTISLTLWNRYEYTKKVFNALLENPEIKDYLVLMFIEPGCQEVIDLAQNFLGQHPNTEIIVNQERLGCQKNIYQAVSVGFERSDFHIHLEDDILPAKDMLRYFEWAKERYKENKNIFTVTAFNRILLTEYCQLKKKLKLCTEVKRRQWFHPWGWATWKDRWEEIKAGWCFVDPGWGPTLNKKTRKDRYEIFPTLARCQNIGSVGLHISSPEWHENHHFNRYWIGSLPFKNSTFRYKEFYEKENI